MSPRFLLDTNVVSEPLRSSPDAGVMCLLARHGGELAIASLVWHELWFGCRRLPASRKRVAIERYLLEVVERSMAILPYDAESAAWHARERARLSRRGAPAPFVDGQIAAIAHCHDLTLITANRRDFRGFQGVRVESWFGSAD